MTKTSLAKETMAKSDLLGVVVPPNITPGMFVQVAADNNDLNEETLNGRNTTHVTILVMYQKGLFSSKQYGNVAGNFADHSRKQRSLGKSTANIGILDCGVHGKRAAVVDHIGNIKKEWYKYAHEENSALHSMDLIWALLRMSPTELSKIQINSINPRDQKVPSWSAFNALVSSNFTEITRIGYCPLIKGSPTEFSTVYTIMKTTQKISKSLGQKTSVVTFDLAIYVKAKELQWRRPKESSDTVIRMGGFHIALNYLAVLGKKYEDSGICDIFVDSEVYGSSTVCAVMKGKSYNCGVRCHKLLMEALVRLQWKVFTDWMGRKNIVLEDVKIIEIIQACLSACDNGDDLSADVAPLSSTVTPLAAQFQIFKKDMCLKSAMFCFWDDYISMVQHLLLFIRAERTGNWKLHLTAINAMLPYFYAMDRVNYSRWLPVYIADMRNLEVDHRHPCRVH